tara:strand:- start:65 stop:898 length:834 start_codon:yes stop_codon:yes gene_type:complete
MPKSAKYHPSSGAISLNDIHIEASGGPNSGVSGTECSFDKNTNWDIQSGFGLRSVGYISYDDFANENANAPRSFSMYYSQVSAKEDGSLASQTGTCGGRYSDSFFNEMGYSSSTQDAVRGWRWNLSTTTHGNLQYTHDTSNNYIGDNVVTRLEGVYSYNGSSSPGGGSTNVYTSLIMWIMPNWSGKTGVSPFTLASGYGGWNSINVNGNTFTRTSASHFVTSGLSGVAGNYATYQWNLESGVGNSSGIGGGNAFARNATSAIYPFPSRGSSFNFGFS